MKKILYIVSTLNRCGPINQLSYIVKYLDKKIFKPIVLTLSPEPQDSLQDYFIDKLNVTVNTLRLSRIKGVFFAKKYIKKYINKHDINLIHAQGIRADWIMSSISTIPKVSTLRNYPYYDYPMTYGKFQGILMAKMHLRYLKGIDRPFVVSKSVSQMLKEKNNYRIDFIRNGTDVEKFQNLNKVNLRIKLGYKINTKIFVSVGHLSDLKDPITLMTAFKEANIPDSLLIFLGDGQLKDLCQQEIAASKNILLLGRVENVHEYLGASDYFISSSLAEGLPNSVLEAMASGLPCILSDIPPHREIYELNNNSSLLFETRDIKGLSALMKEIINKDYEIMSKASKEVIYTHLSAEIMSRKYQDVYLELLGFDHD